MCKVQLEKEALKKLLEQAEKLTEKNRKAFWKEIVRAYELIRTYFVAKLVPSGTRSSLRCTTRIPGLQ